MEVGALLEHPAEAFAYYRQEGIPRVVCEEKHMGSRPWSSSARTRTSRAASGSSTKGSACASRGRETLLRRRQHRAKAA